MIYQPIYNLFVALITWIPGHQLGWAIIIITLIIRLILLVPQQHMLESQKKLQKIQPKIKAIQKEYKDDQAVLGQKMMELYKTE
jgi:YidC/Oxa1 family membrane protein insertase